MIINPVGTSVENAIKSSFNELMQSIRHLIMLYNSWLEDK